MTRPQQPELERSGRSDVDQQGRRSAREQKSDDTTEGTGGPMPPENRPGHRPEQEQDKPHPAP